MRTLRIVPPTLIAGLLLGATAAVAQEPTEEWLESCRAGQVYSSDRAQERVCEVRELRLTADGRLAVDGRQNGGVTVRGWDRNEVLVQALVAVAAPTQEEAQGDAAAIRIESDGRRIRAEGPRRSGDGGWSVGYRVYVPHRMDLELRARNGGIRVSDVAGRLDMETTNGGIRITGVSGDVRGRAVNGGLHVQLAGRSWQGEGLDLTTTNGGVTLHVPDGYSAELTAGTVNGRISTEIPITVQGDIRRDLSTRLGEGGPPIRVRTTNGAVRIRRS